MKPSKKKNEKLPRPGLNGQTEWLTGEQKEGFSATKGLSFLSLVGWLVGATVFWIENNLAVLCDATHKQQGGGVLLARHSGELLPLSSLFGPARSTTS